MDFFNSMGGLIPLWILGAPLVAAVVGLATLPKVQRRDEQHSLRASLPA